MLLRIGGLLCIFAFVFGPCRAASLRMRAFWLGMNLPYGEALKSDLGAVVVVQWENDGASVVTILLPKIYVRYGRNSEYKNGVLYYHIAYEHTGGKFRITPSSCDERPVQLRPGEMTELRFSVGVPRGAILDNIGFLYWVEGDLADRFSAWSGHILSQIAPDRGGKNANAY